MFKRLLLLLVLALCAGVARYVYAFSYPDVETTRYKEAYAYLSDKGAVRGYSDGNGRPYGSLNRVDALKVLLSLKTEYATLVSDQQKRMPSMALFVDMDQRAWYAPYIEVAFRKGVVTGYPDRSFRPGSALKTEEAIALLMRIYGETGSTGYAKSSTNIANQSNQWYTPYVNLAIEKNLISTNEYLRPGSTITRGQFFDMVYRMEVVREERIAFYNRTEAVVAVPTPRPYVQTAFPTAPRMNTTSTFTNTTSTFTNTSTSGFATTASTGAYGSQKFFAITIPSLGIKDLTITHPSDPTTSQGLLSVLKNGVGHLFSYPGGGGKILIYGHSSGYSWDVSQYTKIFRQVNQLNKGDRVYVTYSGKTYTYEVTYEEAVPASDTSRFKGPGEELILYTCWPPDSITQRYLVHASPVTATASN